MGSVYPAEKILRQCVFKPLQYFGYGKRVFVSKIDLTVITAGFHPDDIFRLHQFNAFIGRNAHLFHTRYIKTDCRLNVPAACLYYLTTVRLNPVFTVPVAPGFILKVLIITFEFTTG